MEITFPALIDLFAATKQVEDKRPKTISWYTSMLRPFSRFLGEGATIKDMTIHNARAFIASLEERTSRYDDHPLSPKQEGGLSPYTIHGYVRTLKAFGAWLEEEGYASSIGTFLFLVIMIFTVINMKSVKTSYQ